MKKGLVCLFLAVFLVMTSLFGLVGCNNTSTSNFEGAKETVQELEEARIGVVTGTMQADALPKALPNADYSTYPTIPDLLVALVSGKIDTFCTDESTFKAMQRENGNIGRLKEAFDVSNYGVIFGKGENLDVQEKFNEYLSTQQENGRLDALREKWLKENEPEQTLIDYESLTGSRTLKMGINSGQKPYAYVKDGKYTGFDVELLADFASKYGYGLDIEDTEFNSVLAGVAGGRYDLGASGFTITDLRKQSVDFSNPYHAEDLVFVLRKENLKKTLQDYQGNNIRVGYVTATYVSTIIDQIFPNAKLLDFSTPSDMILALEQGKIDICTNDASLYTCMKWEGMSVDRLEEPYEISDYGIAFKKGMHKQLREELDEFITSIKQNGQYNALQEKWFGNKEPDEFLDHSTLTGTRGTIKFVTGNDTKPFGYVKNGKTVGYDIEFMISFAKEYGYKLDITYLPFPSILPGLESGKYDVAMAGFSITEERKQSIDFSLPYHNEEVIFIVKGSNDQLDQFNGKNLGVVTGSLYGGYSREQFPNAKIKEFNNFADVLFALKQGKVDGIMLDRPNFNAVAREDEKLTAIKVPAYSVEIGFGFQKTESGNVLQAQMNEFLAKKKADGTIDNLIEKWYGETEPNETIPLENLSGNKNTLKVAIDSTRKPFVYLGKENKPVGFEIEMLYLFCQEYGYNVTLSDLSFASGIAGLATETYDMVCGGLYMTDERKESVNFSDSYMVADVVMAKYERSGIENFFLGLKESFEKTFIRENRWKLIVEGIITTLIISVCSIVGGTMLGFGLYMLARTKNKWVSKTTKGFTKVYSSIMAGTPTLVILMILFYVIFGKSSLDGVVVAIFGFILIFSSFVFNQLSLTVNGVDKGQMEAAYALGYGRNQTFFRIILPQAMRMFLPTYSGEIVSLIKATSVVGYIAVNDLTKMGDVIRGSTYEAFFPLISIAIIYFLVIWGVTALMKYITQKTEPKKRKNKNILKGVQR